MPPSHKKVIVRRFAAPVLQAYLPASGFVSAAAVDLLALDGRRLALPLEQIRSVAYVRDFALGDGTSGARRLFAARPRGAGLWIRLTFLDDAEEIEGLAAADLSLFDDIARDAGIFLTPPDTRSNTQRLFIPRTSIADLRILGLISSGAPRTRSPKPPAAPAADTAPTQEGLFDALSPRRDSAPHPQETDSHG